MANDIDLWNDIEDLEEAGKKVEAKSLHQIFICRYIEYNPKELVKVMHHRSAGGAMYC